MLYYYSNNSNNSTKLNNNMNNSFPDFLLNESDDIYTDLTQYESDSNNIRLVMYDSSESNSNNNYNDSTEDSEEESEEDSEYSEDSEDSDNNINRTDNYDNNITDYGILMNVRTCNNFAICKQNKGSSLNYCDDCFLHFYRNLTKYKNITNKTCPLCLNSGNTLEFVNLYSCDHGICYDCLFSIYWDKSYLLKKPKFPISNLSKSWTKFLNTKKGLQIKTKVINLITFNNYLNNGNFDDAYSLHLRKISLYGMPKNILIHLKDLIFFQCELLEFTNNHSSNQHIKQKSIALCPYCKTSQLIYC